MMPSHETRSHKWTCYRVIKPGLWAQWICICCQKMIKLVPSSVGSSGPDYHVPPRCLASTVSVSQEIPACETQFPSTPLSKPNRLQQEAQRAEGDQTQLSTVPEVPATAVSCCLLQLASEKAKTDPYRCLSDPVHLPCRPGRASLGNCPPPQDPGLHSGGLCHPPGSISSLDQSITLEIPDRGNFSSLSQFQLSSCHGYEMPN